MATKPRDLVTRFLSDVLPFLRGTDKIEDAFHDVADAQGDLERDARESTREVGRAYERMADKVKRETRDSARNTKETFRDAGADAGSELMQNIGEGIGNGQGDVKDALLGTIGGLVPGLGAAGAALGVAVFGVQGLLRGFEEQREKYRKIGADLFEAMRSGMVDQQQKESVLTQALGLDDFSQVLDLVTEQANDLKVPAADLLAYYLDLGKTTIPSVQAAFARADVEQRRIITSGREVNDTIGSAKGVADDVQSVIGEIRTQWDRAAAGVDLYTEAQKRARIETTKLAAEAGRAAYNSQLGAAAPYVKGSR